MQFLTDYNRNSLINTKTKGKSSAIYNKIFADHCQLGMVWETLENASIRQALGGRDQHA